MFYAWNRTTETLGLVGFVDSWIACWSSLWAWGCGGGTSCGTDPSDRGFRVRPLREAIVLINRQRNIQYSLDTKYARRYHESTVGEDYCRADERLTGKQTPITAGSHVCWQTSGAGPIEDMHAEKQKWQFFNFMRVVTSVRRNSTNIDTL